jgi:hypothetical protein
MEEKQLTPEGEELLESFFGKISAGKETEALTQSRERAERYLFAERFKGKYWIEKEKTTVEAVAQGKYLQK